MTEPDKTRQKSGSGLTQAQYNAIDAILTGATDQEAAKRCGVTRQTVNGWKNNDPEFIAELNQRRAALWEAYLDQLRVIAGKALLVLDNDLDDDWLPNKRETAFHILKAVGLHAKDAARVKPSNKMGSYPEPSSPVEPKQDNIGAKDDSLENNR